MTEARYMDMNGSLHFKFFAHARTSMAAMCCGRAVWGLTLVCTCTVWFGIVADLTLVRSAFERILSRLKRGIGQPLGYVGTFRYDVRNKVVRAAVLGYGIRRKCLGGLVADWLTTSLLVSGIPNSSSKLAPSKNNNRTLFLQAKEIRSGNDWIRNYFAAIVIFAFLVA